MNKSVEALIIISSIIMLIWGIVYYIVRFNNEKEYNLSSYNLYVEKY